MAAVTKWGSAMANVLIIDDDDIMREMMTSLLREAGHRVIETSSPIGTTRLCVENSINIVILDVMMPAISGDKLARVLRGNPKLQSLSVILVSSHEIEKLDFIARQVRANAVIQKRDLRDRLVETVGCMVPLQ